ncbi:class I glutamine amidotransferase-like protein [Cryphonectria parasitica EP155]|uniref:Class I glutamine amidotransferase-like protein n=1 Tax=Cryphonectria parasitica (strain ATCC 38755 / EP155) TaxID=660469 RepID=A0A9P5CN84_CRYP1|nr:class I glutamine amidotransferase-like protein [Cryphonectria parasitica EP155]KAF3763640.1 class I glutamine amidotransferase-like protein [Cryphonectria parasitica EP155]
MTTVRKVCILMADYGHEPTEAAVPYTAFKKAGFGVSFATEKGAAPACDKLLLEGLTQKLLGASKPVISQYNAMVASPEHQTPLSWISPDFDLTAFDLVYLPGGHDKAVQQIIDSPTVHKHLAQYFPLTRKHASTPASPSPAAQPKQKAIAAICHGPLVLTNTINPDTGKSVLYECKTTALPAGFEKVAYWGTRLWLGDYYKTYGSGSEDVEVSVKKALREKSLFQGSLLPSPFVVEDDTYNYISARFPGDIDLFSKKVVQLVQSLQ